MSLSADTLRKLATLHLDAEQMAGVIELLADMVEADEQRKAKARERKARSRDKIVTVTGQECDSHNATPLDKETPPTPPKEINPPYSPPNGGHVSVVEPKAKKNAYPADFEQFWSAYPTDKLMSKAQAGKQWKRTSADDRLAAIASVPAFKSYCRENPTYRPVHACRYLSERRFDGFSQQGPPGGLNPDDPALLEHRIHQLTMTAEHSSDEQRKAQARAELDRLAASNDPEVASLISRCAS